MIDRLNPKLRAVEVINGVQRKREFFAMSAEDAYFIFETIAEVSNTKDRLKRISATEEQKEEEREAANHAAEVSRQEAGIRRSKFKFSALGITPGSIITYRYDESIQAEVIDDHNIIVNEINF